VLPQLPIKKSEPGQSSPDLPPPGIRAGRGAAALHRR
jgi:hypothetical protein